MSHKIFRVEEAEAIISRNGGEIQKTISSTDGKTTHWILGKNFGLKVLAAVDFLKNYCNYIQYKDIEKFHAIYKRVILYEKSNSI